MSSSVYSSILYLSPTRQKALAYRIKHYKDEDSMAIYENVASRRNMDDDEILYNFSSAGLAAYPNNNLWKSRYLMGKLRKYGSISNQEKKDLINHLETNSSGRVRGDIYIYICEYKKYKGTEFLKPYENLINEHTKTNGCKFP